MINYYFGYPKKKFYRNQAYSYHHLHDRLQMISIKTKIKKNKIRKTKNRKIQNTFHRMKTRTLTHSMNKITIIKALIEIHYSSVQVLRMMMTQVIRTMIMMMITMMRKWMIIMILMINMVDLMTIKILQIMKYLLARKSLCRVIVRNTVETKI